MRQVVRLGIAVLAFTLLAASCGDDSGDDEPAATGESEAESAEDAASEATGDGLAIVSVTFGADGVVVIENTGSEAVSTAGHQLCNRPSYVALADTTLAPGETLEVAASALGDLPAEGGEVALYSSSSFSSADDILDYVGWGSGGGRLSVAVEAGIWAEGDAVAAGGAAIELTGASGSAAGWSSG